MDMKIKRFLTMCTLQLLLTAPGIFALGADFYLVEVPITQIEPGETTTLNISIKNLGGSYAQYLRASFDPFDTSPIDAIGPAKQALGSASQPLKSDEYFGVVKQSDIINIQYTINAKVNATEGVYNVPLVLDWEDSNGESKNQTLYFGVEVTGKADLRIASVNTSPAKVYPDTEFTLTIDIENIGKKDARSAEVTILLPKEFTGAYESFVGTIKRDKKSTATFELKALKEARAKAYPTVMEVKYTDDKGVEYVEEMSFNIFVHKRGEVNLEIAGVSTSPTKVYPGIDLTLSVQLENIGTQDAKSVKAELNPPGEFIGEYSSFIGKIEEDDVSSGIFDMRISKKAKPGTYDIPMTIIYTDEKGMEYTEEKNFEIFVDKKPRRVPYAYITAGILILVTAIYLWRRRRIEV